MPLPILYVEGKDDTSVVSNLLRRHGIDTAKGDAHLRIQDKGDVDSVLETMAEAIKASTDRPVGFIVDIDVVVTDRWTAVKDKISLAGGDPPMDCPVEGYIGQLADYPYSFGVWLMPDCASDGGKLEHLICTLIPCNDPLWDHAQDATNTAKEKVTWVNGELAAAGSPELWECFREVDTIKAQVRAWLAWQKEPGAQLGAAINDKILGCDSAGAIAFLKWLRQLYGFTQLDHL
jgi:hypothetical protein